MTKRGEMMLNILLVDDRPENLLVLEELLAKEGRRFVRATSGNEALRYVLKGSIGLILLDVQMPDMDGFEVASLIKGNPATKEIPIIFMTAISKDEKFALKGFEGGGIDYLYKPLNPDITRVKIEIFEELFHRQEDLKAANNQLVKMNHQLEDLNMQKNYLLGMAAHDLRNPIWAISQLSELLAGGMAGQVTEEQVQFLSSIRESSDYILHIIEDLLDVTKIEAGKMSLDIRPTNMRTLLEQNISLNRMIAEKKDIRLEWKNDLRSAYLYIDAVKIGQVINNLVSNAIKYSLKGTLISIHAEENDDRLSLSVTDQGLGIPKDEQYKLFNGFQTTSVRGTAGEKSTGLGLLICSKIIKAHGGTIDVVSEPGKGSTFWFSVPVTIAEEQPGPEDFAPGSFRSEFMEGERADGPAEVSPSAGNKMILVVEDDEIAQLVVRKVLKRLGYEAVMAGTGEEALELLEKTDVRMVLMDVHLPGISGIEVTRRIRRLSDPVKQNLPVVGLTGSRMEKEIEACLSAGMNICITKPLIVSELLRTLEGAPQYK
jgi:signal transduction histidine kinase